MSDGEYRDRAVAALERLLPPAEAQNLYDELVREGRFDAITTADHLAQFSARLRLRGGALAIVAGSLASYARIKGASVSD